MREEKAFALKLKAALAIRGLTQGQLKVLAGVSQSAISRSLSGETVPAVDIAARLARALDVSLDWLCDLPPRTPGELTPDETELLNRYRAATPALRAITLNAALAILKAVPPEGPPAA